MSSSSGKATWGTEHDAALSTQLIKIILAHRTDFYDVPELAEFRGHGASKINEKIQQHLKKHEKGYPGAEGATAAAIDGMKRNKSPGNSPKKQTPQSGKGKGGGSLSKK